MNEIAPHVRATYFPDLIGKQRREISMAWSKWIEHLRNPRTYPAKERMPLIKLARFGDVRSDAGSLRHDANIVIVEGVEGDYDGGDVTLADAATMLAGSDVRSLLYSSPSSTPERPRWRVLAPLSQACEPGRRRECVGRLNAILGGILAPESFTLSQAFYIGRAATAAHYEAQEVAGARYIDEIEIEPRYPVNGHAGNGAHVGALSAAAEAVDTDPILRALRERGLLRRQVKAGTWAISCPWESEHTTAGGDAATAYLQASFDGRQSAGFSCKHGHCAERRLGDLLLFLGLREPAKRAVANARAPQVSEHQRDAADATAAILRDAPEPLRRPTPPPEPYPIAELGSILAPACESLRRVIQAPDAVCGAAVLAAASLAVQGLADVHNDGRVHPLSLWMLTIAESGERKSAVDAEAMLPAREYEKELAKGYEAAQETHAALMAEWQAQCEHAKSIRKKKGGEGLADALRAIGPAPSAPLIPRVTVADFTAEGLAKLLVAGLPSVGAFTDEAALVFGGHGMTKETIMRTAGTLSKLWDSGTLDRVRAGDGAVKLYGKRLALHLMAQPIIAERALSDDVLAGQGFLARCLLAWPESTAGRRPLVAENLRNDAALIRYRSRLAELLRRPLPLAEGTHNELAPLALTLATDAFDAWRQVHDAIEAQLVPRGRYAMVKPWASKAPEQCLRIAGVLTLIEQPEAQRIEAATIERAAELTLWHLNEAARLAGTAELSPEIRDAEALLNWCQETGRGMLHSGAALRLGPSRIRERGAFQRAMDELVRAGWAQPIDGGAFLDDAHRRHVWRVAAVREGC